MAHDTPGLAGAPRDRLLPARPRSTSSRAATALATAIALAVCPIGAASSAAAEGRAPRRQPRPRCGSPSRATWAPPTPTSFMRPKAWK